MAKAHFHDVGGTSFQGSTKTEAKERAQAAIDAAFRGEYTPTVLFYRGHHLILFRTYGGWCYRILNPSQIEEGVPIKSGAFTSAEGNFESVYKSAVYHLAQNVWDYGDCLEVPAFVKDAQDRQELASWATFQLRHRYFKQQGFSGGECHSMACDFRHESPPMEELARYKTPPIGGYSTERILPKTQMEATTTT